MWKSRHLDQSLVSTASQHCLRACHVRVAAAPCLHSCALIVAVSMHWMLHTVLHISHQHHTSLTLPICLLICLCICCCMCSLIAAGWLLDHVPGNKLLALALLIEAGGYVVMPLCSSVLQLTVAYGVVGFLFNVLNTGACCMQLIHL